MTEVPTAPLAGISANENAHTAAEPEYEERQTLDLELERGLSTKRYEVPVGFFRKELTVDQDAVFIPPRAERRGSFQCVGGRHIHHVGGKVVWGGEGSAAERYKDVSASLFIEGRHIVMKRSGDAISAGGTFRKEETFRFFPNVYIQNCRVENVHGSLDEVHADIFQMDYAVHGLHIDRLTGDTNYQALFLRPMAPVSSIDLRRCNFRRTAGSGDHGETFLIYFFKNYDDVERSSHMIYLTEIYCDIPAGLDPLHCFSPQSGLSQGADAEGIYVWWPDLTQRIQDLRGRPGRIRIGRPPSGDFVAAAHAGLNYRTPGYQKGRASSGLSTAETYLSFSCE